MATVKKNYPIKNWNARITELLGNAYISENDTHITFDLLKANDRNNVMVSALASLCDYAKLIEAPEITSFKSDMGGKTYAPDFVWLTSAGIGFAQFGWQPTPNDKTLTVEFEVKPDDFKEVCDLMDLVEPGEDFDLAIEGGLTERDARTALICYALKYGVAEQIKQCQIGEQETKGFKPELEALMTNMGFAVAA